MNWLNNRHLLAPIGNILPAEADERYYAILDHTPMAAESDETVLVQSSVVQLVPAHDRSSW